MWIHRSPKTAPVGKARQLPSPKAPKRAARRSLRTRWPRGGPPSPSRRGPPELAQPPSGRAGRSAGRRRPSRRTAGAERSANRRGAVSGPAAPPHRPAPIREEPSPTTGGGVDGDPSSGAGRWRDTRRRVAEHAYHRRHAGPRPPRRRRRAGPARRCSAGRASQTASDVYERARPGYSDEAVAALAELGGSGPGTRVLDLAAGTGKLTRPLAATAPPAWPSSRRPPCAGLRRGGARTAR